MSEIPGKKNKYKQVVKVKRNSTCPVCFESLMNYMDSLELPYDVNSQGEFYAPIAWYIANERQGCPHGNAKLLRSVDEGVGLEK